MPTVANGFALANGVVIPCVGMGTWQVPDDDALISMLHNAIENGYRHIDTAHIYGNERGIGKAIRTCGLPRNKLFVTSKLWNTDRGYQATLTAFERSMDLLNIEYLDAFLLHWPAARGEAMAWQSINSGTWRAMEELYTSGRVRAIGVSNFLIHHLVPLLARAKVYPMINQLEFHPGYTQMPTVEFCRKKGIEVVAWSPLGHGALVRHPLIVEISARYGVTPGQLCLRWCLQQGIVALTKSFSVERQKENTRLFGFNISAEDMKRLSQMPQTCFSGLDPDHVTF